MAEQDNYNHPKCNVCGKDAVRRDSSGKAWCIKCLNIAQGKARGYKEFCDVCGKPAYKTDGNSNTWCESCLTVPPRVKDNVPGRNEPCNCGSGKKYKKCCFKK